tara:strand:+ start:111 stop:608 length:498 start_codon:yes stop_codon:yes gene_type:complete
MTSLTQTCQGCVEDQPNQLAHVGKGGCLEKDYEIIEECIECDDDTDDDSYNDYDFIEECIQEEDEIITRLAQCFRCDFPIEVYMLTNERTMGKRGGTPKETSIGLQWSCSKCEWGQTKWNELIEIKQKKIWPCKVCHECGLKELGQGNSFSYTTSWKCNSCKTHK